MMTAKQIKIEARNQAFLNSAEYQVRCARHELQKAKNGMTMLAYNAPLRYKVAATRRLRAAQAAFDAIAK